jgi:hypothetical protein
MFLARWHWENQMDEGQTDSLRAELAEAARQTFDAVRRERPGETVYAYALVMASIGGEAVQAWCHTEETFAKKESRSPGEAERAGFRRYCPDEWWAATTRSIRTAAGRDWSGLAAALGEEWDRCRATAPDIVLELLIGALRDLDQEGYFGTGLQRDAVTLMIYISDDAHSSRWWPESVRRLNPPAVVKRFTAALPKRRR